MATQSNPPFHNRPSVIKPLPLVRLMPEGSEFPRGYAMVRVRPDYYGAEVALIPFHRLLKLYYKIRRASQRHYSEEELRTLKTVQTLLQYRGDRKYQEGLAAGIEQGFEKAARFTSLLKQNDLKIELTDGKAEAVTRLSQQDTRSTQKQIDRDQKNATGKDSL